eukprot:6903967-Lingulodinium_polyedra.AAC.1
MLSRTNHKYCIRRICHNVWPGSKGHAYLPLYSAGGGGQFGHRPLPARAKAGHRGPRGPGAP